MKRSVIITGVVVVVAIVVIILFSRATSRKDIANLYVESKRGQFEIVVTTTGELQAENSVDIKGPDFSQARGIRIMDIRIQDLVPEGTEVKVGDYIATLDKTSFENTLRDELERLITYETDFEMAILDTSVNLSNLRDNIKNQTFSVEEAEITLEQSVYEPPTTIRQAEINLDKIKRQLDQTLRSYELQVERARSTMRNQNKRLSDQQQRVNDLEKLLAQFEITAPSPGMVIYKRDRSGAKRRIGSSINAFDNVVATLPDMSSMLSKTYVNEIDVSKVGTGQRVELLVDAFPERTYTGVVLSVANIGEQLPNTDAKVFEALIKVDGSDPILKPSMTTGNKIVTKTINDVVYIPLECVQVGSDSIPFVYLRNGTKQIVVTGETNENHVIIEQGLSENTLVFLSMPEKPETFKLAGEELISIIREREQIKREEEKNLREEAERTRNARPTMRGRATGQGVSAEMRERIIAERAASGDTTVVRFREGAQQGNQQPPTGARARQDGNQQPAGVRDTTVRQQPVQAPPSSNQ